ncbi:MAG: hypothetical protein N3F07_00785 [Candidatus Micrarchaeota archaeon]|nr:hypothetical protein [Candidatus Micrarchaeota archaeon]
MQKILLDTSFLMLQFEDGIDLSFSLQELLDSPACLLLPTGMLSELRAIAGRGGRRASAARFVLQNLPQILRGFAVEQVESKGPLDEWIFKYAEKNKVTVATNDAKLRSRLKKAGIPAITAKSKAKLGYV